MSCLRFVLYGLPVKRGDQMRRMAIVCIVVVSWASLAWSQSAQEKFVGTWSLGRIETRAESGDWTAAKTRLGSNPIGTLTYDRAGNMAVQIMRRDRTPLSSGGLAEVQSVSPEALALAPLEEKAIAFECFPAGARGRLFHIRHTRLV